MCRLYTALDYVPQIREAELQELPYLMLINILKILHMILQLVKNFR
ncbi:hypothetical protein [Clostridium butyricum]|nr:hypothetical protein [Clostridium butyricum]